MTELTITKHARERIMERFKIPAECVEKWAAKHYRKAEYVTTVHEDNPGNDVRVYLTGEIVFIMGAIDDRVVTVYPAGSKSESYSPGIDNLIRVRRLIHKDVRRLRGMMRHISARSMRDKLRIETELTERRRQFLRSLSEPRRLALQARINALELALAEINAEETVRKSNVSRRILEAVNGWKGVG